MEATNARHTMMREQGINLPEERPGGRSGLASRMRHVERRGENPPTINDRARGGRPRRRTGASENQGGGGGAGGGRAGGVGRRGGSSRAGHRPPWREEVAVRPMPGREKSRRMWHIPVPSPTPQFFCKDAHAGRRGGRRARRVFDDYRSAKFPLGGLPRIDTTIRTGSLHIVLVGNIVAICLLAGRFPSTLLTAITGLLSAPFGNMRL